VITLVPPDEETVAGDAVTATLEAAAAPIVICTTLVVVVVAVVPVPVVVEVPLAAPDVARTSATPDVFRTRNVVTASPLRVCASTGLTVPSDVEKRTVVPFCTGVPLCSATNAVTSVLPPRGSCLVAAETLIVELVGASS
jgi:hypothetical protein